MSIDRSLSDGVQSSRERILSEVKAIVAGYGSGWADEIREDHRLVEDLGCDSLDQVEITMEVEEHFDVSVPDEFAERVRTVGDIADGVLQLLGQAK